MDLYQKSQLGSIFYSMREIDFLVVFFIVAGAILLTILVQKLLPWLAEEAPGRFRPYILPLVPILRLLVLAVALFSVIPLFIKPTFQNLVALLGAVGVALGFAVKDYVSSLIAGIVAIYEQPYRPGDWITVDGAYGEVRSVGLRAVRIVTADDTTVTIPHNKIWTTNIYNANAGRREHLCVAEFYLDPGHDAGAARERLRDVALTSPYLQAAKPVVVIVSETPWGTRYRLKAYPMDGRDEFQFTSDLTVRGKAALAEIGARPALVPLAPPAGGPGPVAGGSGKEFP